MKDLPQDANQVRGWFWMPENRPEQPLLDRRIVEAPATFRITRDPRYGRSWLCAEAPADAKAPLRVVTEFTIVRRPAAGMGDCCTDPHALIIALCRPRHPVPVDARQPPEARECRHAQAPARAHADHEAEASIQGTAQYHQHR